MCLLGRGEAKRLRRYKQLKFCRTVVCMMYTLDSCTLFNSANYFLSIQFDLSVILGLKITYLLYHITKDANHSSYKGSLLIYITSVQLLNHSTLYNQLFFACKSDNLKLILVLNCLYIIMSESSCLLLRFITSGGKLPNICFTRQRLTVCKAFNILFCGGKLRKVN